MKHFAIEQWVDFSRDLIEQKDRSQMQEHLTAGCNACQKLVDLTQGLISCCAAISADPVPDGAVRLARAIFPPGRPRLASSNLVPVEVIFDSFVAPVPAGLRSTWQVGWQGLYRAGDCSLDLRIEPELKSSRAAVIGQIANHVVPSDSMSDIAISLRAGKQIVAETVSNRFGEFQMEYEQKSRLQLVIHLQGRVVQLPLKKLVFDQPATKSRISSKR